jgi:hypothetical protein
MSEIDDALELVNRLNNIITENSPSYVKATVILGREYLQSRQRIATLESQLAAANKMPTVPYDVLHDMLDLVKLLTMISVTQKLPPETEEKLDNVYATIIAIAPHEQEVSHG